ncbi:MAG: hypothetical protein H6869_09265 [Rhodospirillales bacterium]|nr:hypothetical protein [Rhodospirillales bacterium]
MKNLYGYDVLIERFLKNEITALQFQDQYLDKYFADKDPLSEELFLQLDWLFAEAESYTHLPLGPGDNPDHYISESQLRKSAAEVLQKIRALT